MKRAFIVAFAFVAFPTAARADAPAVFGTSPRSAALAGADVAAADPLDAARQNAAASAVPGLAVRAGYGYAAMRLQFDGRRAGVDDVSGTTFAAHYGLDLGHEVSAGGAFAVYFPDRYLAKLSFRPATEPQFVLYESPLDHVSVDGVVAIKYRRYSLGGGVALGFDVGGSGTAFQLGQDARGTYADADLNVALPLRVAPIVGASVDLAPVTLGATFRGALSTGVAIDSFDTIQLNGSPLNGTTTVKVRGETGYDPARLDFGGQIELPHGLAVLAAIELAFYDAMPPPVADVELDVHLGTTPGQRVAHFVEPRFRDTLSPKLAVECRFPEGPSWRLAARAGYAYVPSPVPAPTGFTTYVDSDRHDIGFGAGVHLGKLAGVDLTVDLAGSVHLLATRAFEKPDPSLPYPQGETSGDILSAAAALQGRFR